jgi:hypothetical protein
MPKAKNANTGDPREDLLCVEGTMPEVHMIRGVQLEFRRNWLPGYRVFTI